MKLWNSKIGIIWNILGILGICLCVLALLLGMNMLARECSRTVKEFLGVESYW